VSRRAAATGEPAGTHTIGFVLVPDFTLMAFTSAIEPLRLANRACGRAVFDWRLFSEDGRPVRASNGVEVAVDGAFAALEALPQIVVCGALDLERRDHTALIQRLRRLAPRGPSIGAVCTGSYVLAKAGLLDGYRCTIHWQNRDSLLESFPGLQVTEDLYEIDRDRFTCAGGTAAIDLMLSFVAMKCGPAIAAQVTDGLIHHRIREKQERQRMGLRARLGVANEKVLAAVARMENHLEEPLSCVEVADAVGLSPRQLERLFQKYIGKTPTRYYLDLRLNRARALLRQTSLSILAVGVACGFVSASHFSKCYADLFGRSPSDERAGARRTHAPAPALRRSA
jgi:transcriptional regulator GlxA family with amidase domain